MAKQTQRGSCHVLLFPRICQYQSPSGRGPRSWTGPGDFSEPIANNAVSAPPGFFCLVRWEIRGLSAEKSQQLRKCWLLVSFDKSRSVHVNWKRGLPRRPATTDVSLPRVRFHPCQGVGILQKSNFCASCPCQPLFRCDLQSRVQLPTAVKNRHGTWVLAYPERG